MKKSTPILILFCALVITILGSFTAAESQKTEKVGWVQTVQQDLHGWTVHVDKRLLEGPDAGEGSAALSMLANHLERIAVLVEGERLDKLKKLEIQIELTHPELDNMQYHPSVNWLKEHGYDPSLVKKVHIPHAKDLVSRQQMLKHPAVILHELAHAYHDQILSFDHPEIIQAYEAAMQSKSYEEVMAHTGKEVSHYAATNHKEYFAEATEAYLYHNDFYPFVAAELKQHDPTAYQLMEKIWGKRE